jgi:putative endonuclease
LAAKNKTFKGFTEKYNLTKLVWFEAFDDISIALEYEKKVKAWRREKRVALIEGKNPQWNDLAENWFAVERILPKSPDPSVG